MGRIIRQSDGKHRCDPSGPLYPSQGMVWECSCGKQYIWVSTSRFAGHWRRKWFRIKEN